MHSSLFYRFSHFGTPWVNLDSCCRDNLDYSLTRSLPPPLNSRQMSINVFVSKGPQMALHPNIIMLFVGVVIAIMGLLGLSYFALSRCIPAAPTRKRSDETQPLVR